MLRYSSCGVNAPVRIPAPLSRLRQGPRTFLGSRNGPVGTNFALLAMTAIAFASASQVRAQAVGFVWNNNPTTSGTTTPASAYSYNSSGGVNTVTRNSVGSYTVNFPGLGNGLNSNVEVTPYGTGPAYCMVGNWSSSGSSEVQVNIDCYNRLAAAVDHSFTVLYQARTHSDPTTPSVAFLWANQPTTASYTPELEYQYNAGGGTNTITRSSTGNYTANLPGFSATGGTVIVSAYGSAPAHCQVTSWSNSSAGAVVNVNCTDSTGISVDEYFTLVYSIYETAGYSPGSANGGAIWAFKSEDTSPYDVSTRYSIAIDGEEMLAQKIAKGSYTWTMNVEPEWAESTVLVTAYGALGSYCNVNDWSSTSTTTTVYVLCFNASGAPVDTKFTATFQLAGVS